MDSTAEASAQLDTLSEQALVALFDDELATLNALTARRKQA
jgi:hypothetical protein